MTMNSNTDCNAHPLVSESRHEIISVKSGTEQSSRHKVPQCFQRMMKKHPRAAETHDGSNPISHIRTIAVHWAFVAFGLGVTILAVVQTRQSIVKQFPALTAQLIPSMVLPAPQFNHMADRSLLPGNATHT